MSHHPIFKATKILHDFWGQLKNRPYILQNDVPSPCSLFFCICLSLSFRRCPSWYFWESGEYFHIQHLTARFKIGMCAAPDNVTRKPESTNIGCTNAGLCSIANNRYIIWCNLSAVFMLNNTLLLGGGVCHLSKKLMKYLFYWKNKLLTIPPPL